MVKQTKSIAAAVALTALLGLPALSHAGDRNWSFSVSGFGGRSFPESSDISINCGTTCADPDPAWWGKAHGFGRTAAPSWGAKATAWYLRRNYDWQPQVGLELDWTRFITSIHPQTQGATGTWTGPSSQLGYLTLLAQKDFSVNIVAINLLFRYPIGVSESLPEGRWYPYLGIGGGVQRTSQTWASVVNDVSYSPEWQALAGAKFFIFRNFAIFGEWKRTSGTFRSGFGFPEYRESTPIVSNHLVGGVALHF